MPPPPPVASPPIPGVGPKKGKQPVYAVVQYDFIAERPDELDAKKGEPIMVMAQSNHEWSVLCPLFVSLVLKKLRFVAKPIGRLGGPGLIPVAFVEIRDPASGRAISVPPDAIPMVEEWKKAAADYKNASIPLGRFDLEPPISSSTLPRSSSVGNAQPPQSIPPSQSSQPPQPVPHYRPEQDLLLPPGNLVNLNVPSFHNESGNYWFRLQVSFVPDEPKAPAYKLSLYRTYEEFYDFQISLLDTFPFEAGRPKGDEDPPERILPYMPGPVDDQIDDELTEYRREELDLYVRALVDLRSRGAGYIVRHELFRTFFAAKSGDYCEEVSRDDVMEELEERLSDTRLDDRRRTGPSDGRPSMDRNPSHDRPSMDRRPSHDQAIPNGGRPPNDRRPSAPDIRSASAASQHSAMSPVEQSRPDSSERAGPSTGGTNGSVAAGGQQPPFIKIKIYDRSTDDLIALRVHPNVTYAELFEKVRARLGPEVSTLRCRTSMTGPGGGGGYRDVRDDRDLRDWMRVEDQKMVLYAE